MKILITGMWHEATEHIDEIRQMGHDVIYIENESENLPCSENDFDGVICCQVFKYHPIEKFSNLKFIQTESAGYDRIPHEYAREHGIRVFNVGDTYAGPMSEYVICMLLDWYRNRREEEENQKQHGWNFDFTTKELTGKKVCIIGSGNVAKYTARKLKVFDCDVVSITNSVRSMEYFDEVRGYDKLKETLAEADVVILATPPHGKPVIGKDELISMKKTSVLVNIARGSQVDQEALIEALKNKDIEAAILDVFAEEPLSENNELWILDNVLITPHSSYIGENNGKRLWEVIKHNLRKDMSTVTTMKPEGR